VGTTEQLQDAAVVRRRIAAPPEKVWAALTDGWVYPGWVVGASRMRDVEAGWPRPGTTLHHSVGVWPVLIDDATECLDWEEGRMLLLRAHGWPAGAAEVEVTLDPAEGGTEVTMREDAVAGPGRLVPHAVRQLMSVVRNREALRRLSFLAERRG
jgi:uncharacterized protein YndB with AHSA1/START domain